MADEPLVLGIETSCDETGVGIVRGQTLLADAVASSVDEHARFGGVVPEVAAGRTWRRWCPTLDAACRTAGVRLADVDAIAVTAGPGLAGALLVGVGAAKALALALGVPLHGVNHLAATSPWTSLEHGPLAEPDDGAAGLRWTLLAAAGRRHRPRDCASRSAPPSTTRPARPSTRWRGCSGCPTPAGRTSTAIAVGGDRAAIAFPRGLTAGHDMDRHRYDFSFSGLKTAVARWVEAREADGRRPGAPMSRRRSRRRWSTC